jgi:curved DNA-binding protein CbpA
MTHPWGDLYALLGVKQTATTDEIRRAFRTLGARAHPDKRPNDPSALPHFQRLSEAYHTLSDAERRAAYDRLDAGAAAHAVTPARAAELHAEDLRRRYQRGYAAGLQALSREDVRRRLVGVPSLPAPRTPEEMGFQDAVRARLGAEMRRGVGAWTASVPGDRFAGVPSGKRSDGTG